MQVLVCCPNVQVDQVLGQFHVGVQLPPELYPLEELELEELDPPLDDPELELELESML